MNLKPYQERCLNDVKKYVDFLKIRKREYDNLISNGASINQLADFSALAMRDINNDYNYNSKQDGIGNYIPNICLKVPTGGGKTLLATRSIDIINCHYRLSRTGLVLWIVPTDQIYKQTLECLKNREHPYRQMLDQSSLNNTIIIEKTDSFTKDDIDNNLVILMLMLPSANRQNNETLKIFRDRSGFGSFFPEDDNYQEHEELLELYPNLDYYEQTDSFFGRQVKTSLGNTLRVIRPIVIIDEGQRAYSEGAQRTIRGFNPSFILELSATPVRGSNALVNITGKEVNDAEMIKLDIHVINKSTNTWQEVLLDSIRKRNELEALATIYEENTGIYIRPISLIQVERTGKEQRGIGYIHAEDVRDYLISNGINEKQIAIKSSTRNEIEDMDLLSKNCEVRYIITKTALQEGWDCPFAYILTSLANTGSQIAMTQLVGRILRQPYAKKTNILELNESYVFCYRENTNEVVTIIKNSLNNEGLGDLVGRVVSDINDTDQNNNTETTICYRDEFESYKGKIILPRFVINENNRWRDISYEIDIIQNIEWEQLSLEHFRTVVLGDLIRNDVLVDIGLSSNDDSDDYLETRTVLNISENKFNKVLAVRHISPSIIPNPWQAYEIVESIFQILQERYSVDEIDSSASFIISEMRVWLTKEKDRLAEDIFRLLLEDNKICFMVESNSNNIVPSQIIVKSNDKHLVRNNNTQIEKSLLIQEMEKNFNELEKTVAIYIDNKDEILWWYRNRSRKDYYIQGWKKNKIYPDFILTKVCEEGVNYLKAYVLETKGIHLTNEDTEYKESIFSICNQLAEEITWLETDEIDGKGVKYKVIFSDQWQNEINRLFEV